MSTIADVGKKISVSLSEADLAFLDAHVKETGLPGRSAGIKDAIRQLRSADLQAEYEAEFREMDWDEFRSWETTAMDGLEDEPWDEGHR